MLDLVRGMHDLRIGKDKDQLRRVEMLYLRSTELKHLNFS